MPLTMRRRNKADDIKSQLEFDLDRPREADRNFERGGRSFYFFDFDDNVAFLSTPIVIFAKADGREKLLSSGEFARYSKFVGKEGPYKDYYIDQDEKVGSFRYCRDQDHGIFERLMGKKQAFLADLLSAMSGPDHHWKAPSWNYFYHAVYNKRPLSIITARGHGTKTIRDGIDLMINEGHLPNRPNYLSIYPVTNPHIRRNDLGDHDLSETVPFLKRKAIRLSVERAIEKYGYSPFHRFGMSDDDPANVELITEEMRVLKREYPDMSFFVIHTTGEDTFKREVFEHRVEESAYEQKIYSGSQLSLF